MYIFLKNVETPETEKITKSCIMTPGGTLV